MSPQGPVVPWIYQPGKVSRSPMCEAVYQVKLTDADYDQLLTEPEVFNVPVLEANSSGEGICRKVELKVDTERSVININQEEEIPWSNLRYVIERSCSYMNKEFDIIDLCYRDSSGLPRHLYVHVLDGILCLNLINIFRKIIYTTAHNCEAVLEYMAAEFVRLEVAVAAQITGSASEVDLPNGIDEIEEELNAKLESQEETEKSNMARKDSAEVMRPGELKPTEASKEKIVTSPEETKRNHSEDKEMQDLSAQTVTEEDKSKLDDATRAPEEVPKTEVNMETEGHTSNDSSTESKASANDASTSGSADETEREREGEINVLAGSSHGEREEIKQTGDVDTGRPAEAEEVRESWKAGNVESQNTGEAEKESNKKIDKLEYIEMEPEYISFYSSTLQRSPVRVAFLYSEEGNDVVECVKVIGQLKRIIIETRTFIFTVTGVQTSMEELKRYLTEHRPTPRDVFTDLENIREHVDQILQRKKESSTYSLPIATPAASSVTSAFPDHEHNIVKDLDGELKRKMQEERELEQQQQLAVVRSKSDFLENYHVRLLSMDNEENPFILELLENWTLMEERMLKCIEDNAVPESDSRSMALNPDSTDHFTKAMEDLQDNLLNQEPIMALSRLHAYREVFMESTIREMTAIFENFKDTDLLRRLYMLCLNEG